jgi:hypothetical protein
MEGLARVRRWRNLLDENTSRILPDTFAEDLWIKPEESTEGPRSPETFDSLARTSMAGIEAMYDNAHIIPLRDPENGHDWAWTDYTARLIRVEGMKRETGHTMGACTG